MSVFLDMAYDGGYRGEEAAEVAQRLEYEALSQAYAQAAEAEALEDMREDLAHRPQADEELPF
jgi:hypothetical protein